MASTTSRNPGPVLRLPPYSSVRWLVTGLKAVEEVVVGGVDLHPIHPALLDPSGRLAKLLDNFLDVLPGGRLASPRFFPLPSLAETRGRWGFKLGVGVGAGWNSWANILVP